MKKLLLSLLIVLLTGCQKANNSIITLDEYNNISIGIGYEELKDIVGSECQNSTELQMPGIKQEIYTCAGKGPEAVAIFTFQNDKLVAKTQIGLE